MNFNILTLSVQIGSRNLDERFYQHSQKSLLWIHGGHPIVPSSAKLYDKQQLLLELCGLVWPTKSNPYKQGMAGCCSDS